MNLWIAMAILAWSALADEAQLRTVSRKKIVGVEIVGTDRVSVSTLSDAFGLSVGSELNENLVMNTRQSLLSLGLFRSVMLTLAKTPKPDEVIVKVHCTDDPSVITSQALGLQLGVAYQDTGLSRENADNPPVAMRTGLVSRNLFGSFHRASLGYEFASDTQLRGFDISYGLPRIIDENLSFDVDARVADIRYKYLDQPGFAGQARGVWTMSAGEGDVFFGPAMQFNRGTRFGYEGFPETVAGPRVGYRWQSRLLGFSTSPGHTVSVAATYATGDPSQSLVEGDLGTTFALNPITASLELKALAIGLDGGSLRGEARLEWPFLGKKQSTVMLIRARSGMDRYDKRELRGSSLFAGVQHLSEGFLASLGIEITRSPQQTLGELR